MDKEHRILLVEDAESILTALHDYLSAYFEVFSCPTVFMAMEEVQKRKKQGSFFDLVIADIHLTDETGFGLIRYCQKHSPETKFALITSYDINNYIDQIYKEEIGHVVSKQSNLSLKYIHVMATKIVTADIFGVQKYFPDIRVYYPLEMPAQLLPKNKELFSMTIHSPKERVYWVDKIAKIFHETMEVSESYIKLILEEITMNALIRAPRHEDQSFKFQKQIPGSDQIVPKEEINLEEEDYFIVQYGIYDDFIILVCQDNHGTLRKKEILYRLRRHIIPDARTGLPQGLHDSHGRGFFLLREQLTHLVVNIQQNRKTEIICLYSKKHDTVYKNISIYEIE